MPDPEDGEELVVTLAEFLDRFPAGDYILTGKNNENEWLSGSAELTVAEVGWEVVVGPDCDVDFEPERVFSAQLPPDYTSVTVPEEFLESFLEEDCSEFKFEVGATEVSGYTTPWLPRNSRKFSSDSGKKANR